MSNSKYNEPTTRDLMHSLLDALSQPSSDENPRNPPIKGRGRHHRGGKQHPYKKHEKPSRPEDSMNQSFFPLQQQQPHPSPFYDPFNYYPYFSQPRGPVQPLFPFLPGNGRFRPFHEYPNEESDLSEREQEVEEGDEEEEEEQRENIEKDQFNDNDGYLDNYNKYFQNFRAPQPLFFDSPFRPDFPFTRKSKGKDTKQHLYFDPWNLENIRDEDIDKGEITKTLDTKDKDKTSQKPDDGKVSKPGEIASSLYHPPAPFPPISDFLQVSSTKPGLNLPFAPPMNVYDFAKSYSVVLAVSGTDPSSLEIDFHPSTHELIVKGSVSLPTFNEGEEELKELKDGKVKSKIVELRSGHFQRIVKFPLFPKIDEENIKANYTNNGYLIIKIKKLPEHVDSVPKPKKKILIEDIPDESTL